MMSAQRIWNWFQHIRYRSGFGIQSPTDFFLATSVIYEKSPYYAYYDLCNRDYNNSFPHYRTKVNKLLFRLVNFHQPSTIIEVGCDNGAALDYMKAAKREVQTFPIRSMEQEKVIYLLREAIKQVKTISCLHIAHTPYYQEVYEEAILYTEARSWFIVANIYESKEKQDWWKRVKEDIRTGITFDLYDLGLVFFDKKRYKEHYIIHF